MLFGFLDCDDDCGCTCYAFHKNAVGFFINGAAAVVALTGVQSISRTMVGLFAPEGKNGEFFGIFSVAGRTSSFIGPTIYGVLTAEAALWFEAGGMSTLIAEQNGQRIAIVAIAIFLFVGLVILFTVNESKALQAAISAPSDHQSSDVVHGKKV